jgi:hypothetical protein
MALAVLCIWALLTADRRTPAAARKDLIASLRAWDLGTRSGARHYARLVVWAINSRIALLLYTRDARIGAELAASRMRTSGATFRKTWRARLAFVAGGSASVTARAVCPIAFLQAWPVGSLVGLLFEIVALVADSAAEMPTIQHVATSSDTLESIFFDIDIARYGDLVVTTGNNSLHGLPADHNGWFLMFEARQSRSHVATLKLKFDVLNDEHVVRIALSSAWLCANMFVSIFELYVGLHVI